MICKSFSAVSVEIENGVKGFIRDRNPTYYIGPRLFSLKNMKE